MKIAIVTQALLNNYGGILQNYAVQLILRRLGHDPVTFDLKQKNHYESLIKILPRRILYSIMKVFFRKKINALSIPRYQKRARSMDIFVKENISLTKCVKKYEKKSVENCNADVILVGSDQVWRPKYNHYLEDMYLDFAKKSSLKKIAYAASFGVDEWEYTPKQTEACSALAKKFNAISVREESGVKLCKDHLGVDATWVLDPTLLLKKDDYLKLCQEIPVNSNRFMAVYVLNLNDSVKATYESIAKEKNLEIKYFAADAKASLSIPEWLAMFRDASYVVTDSFHGTVFSIIFGKEFKCIYNETRGVTRFESLLNLYNSGKLEEMREFSLNWLKNALES